MDTQSKPLPADLARRIRKHVVLMTSRANSAHIGSSLSVADILAVLYGKVLRFRAQEPDWPERDRFILSKGHSCAALYAVLAESGYEPGWDPANGRAIAGGSMMFYGWPVPFAPGLEARIISTAEALVKE